MIAAKTETAAYVPAEGLLGWIAHEDTHAELVENSRLRLTLAKSNTTTGMPAGLRRIDVRPRSTGKERDAETNLDYFGARYFSGAQGRFTSSDPMGIMRQKLFDPQQWNAYAYVRNNPLRFVDPTGMYTCADSAKCDSKNDIAFQARLDAISKARQGLEVGSAEYYKLGAILKSYGGAGDTKTAAGKTVSVDFTNKGDGGTTLKTSVDTISVNFNSDFAKQSKDNTMGMDGLVAHEGQHVLDGAPKGPARLGSEIRAEGATQAVFRGLSSQSLEGMTPGSSVGQGAFTMWSPMWREPAYGFLGGVSAWLLGNQDYKNDVASDKH